MNHIGNDIIDLKTAMTQTHKLRQRSIEKIFNPSEIAQIKNNSDAMLAYWHLWSVKESAYKAWQRINNCKPIFNSIQFNCLEFSGPNTLVVNGEFSCTVNSIVNREYIYSQCQSDGVENKLFSSRQSYEEWLSQLSDKGWILRKNSFNIPHFYNSTSSEIIPLSTSHDGTYYAVVCERESLT